MVTNNEDLLKINKSIEKEENVQHQNLLDKIIRKGSQERANDK